jgi:hypothetical protein
MGASERLRQAHARFYELETRLRRARASVDATELDEVVAAIDEALPGLAGAELGRALVFKADVLWWQHFLRLTRAARWAEDADDPAVQQGISCAVEGRALLRRDPDSTEAERSFADEVVRRLQATA